MKRSKARGASPSETTGDDFDVRLEQLRTAMTRAARERGASGEGFEGLRARLFTAVPDVKMEAARTLRHYGLPAVEPLCLALRDPDLRVRTAAAESLGELEDPRAIQPLVEALRALFARRSARWDFWVGVAQVLGMLTALGLTLATFTAVRNRSLHQSAELLNEFEDGRQRRNDLLQAIATALGRIGERHPSTELCSILPELKFVARDVIQQRKSTRAASREAAARIEALAAHLQELPVPVADGRAELVDLPGPAVEPGSEVTAGRTNPRLLPPGS